MFSLEKTQGGNDSILQISEWMAHEENETILYHAQIAIRELFIGKQIFLH